MTQARLTITPITLRDARAFVLRLHRHHLPPKGHKFSVACADPAGTVRGVAIVGRPVSRVLDDGRTLEVLRVCTDGTPNACSCLYGAAWRVSVALGYRRVVTYTLDTEPGTSLKAAGWSMVGPAGGGSWSRPSRPREDRAPTQRKVRWERVIAPQPGGTT